MRVRDRLLIFAEWLVGTLQWVVASHHLRTDPACVEHRAPRAGSRLDRVSRGYGCSRCLTLRAWGRIPESPNSGDSDG